MLSTKTRDLLKPSYVDGLHVALAHSDALMSIAPNIATAKRVRLRGHQAAGGDYTPGARHCQLAPRNPRLVDGWAPGYPTQRGC